MHNRADCPEAVGGTHLSNQTPHASIMRDLSFIAKDIRLYSRLRYSLLFRIAFRRKPRTLFGAMLSVMVTPISAFFS